MDAHLLNTVSEGTAEASSITQLILNTVLC